MMKFFVKTFCSFMAILTMNANIQKSYAHPEFSDKQRLEKIQQVFPKIKKIYQDYAEKNHFPAFAFGIMVDGKLIYSEAEGYVNIEKKIPSDPNSMFRIASMTKGFTAMAILKLRDNGQLKLDDPVSLYIPEIKNQHVTSDSSEITIRDLLTHSAGFPLDNAWGDRQLNMSKKELKILLKKGLSFSNTSGISYEYSNLGFALLGMVIDEVSKMPYQEYIEKNIWQPLNMNDVSWEVSKIPSQKLVQGYHWNKTQWNQEKMLSDGAFGAMGGMISSLNSFSHYVALQQDVWPPRNDPETGPVKRSSIREMQQAWRFQELNTHYQFLNGHQCTMSSAYGYGLKWLRDCEGRTYVGHSGGLPGFGSNWFIMPDYGIGVILFANSTYAPAAEVNLQVLNELVKDANLQPRVFPPTTLLKDRQAILVKLLQNWDNPDAITFLADNFFLDSSIAARKQESISFFEKTGGIIRINEVIPENLLSGHFIIEGKKANLKINFTLTPQNPALIQEVRMELISKACDHIT
ncbi:serine hydrolase domain-containing protein [Legionella dresdenensis]|uniref:Serine hydrolase domain-containing protein n=1 Tax=Legionella dresdenensis TaxID=450200 RepID=A0ABV8CDM6_9GAMM